MNFVVIGEARSGTTMVNHYLDSQKNICCAGDPTYEKRLPPPNINLSLYLDKVCNDKKTLTNKKFCGFKTVLGRHVQLEKTHNFSLIEYIKEKNSKIILLTRKNAFLREFSLQKAIKTNIWHLKPYEPIPKIEISFSVKQYLERKKIYEQNKSQLLSLISNLNIQYMECFYEDFVSENKHEWFKNLTVFIGCPLHEFTLNNNPPRKILNTLPIKDQLKNFNHVSKLLKDDSDFIEALSVFSS